MPLTKPASKTDWGVGNPDPGLNIIEPTGAKKISAWAKDERPSYEFMNFLFNNTDAWIKYLESVTDQIAVTQQIVIGDTGTIPGATHDTLADAVADGAEGSNRRVLILPDTYTLEAFTDLTKSGWEIQCLPGVIFVKGGGAPTEAIRFSGANIKWRGGRFEGWSGGGDAVFLATSTGHYGQLESIYFQVGTNNEFDDSAPAAGKKFSTSQLTTEV